MSGRLEAVCVSRRKGTVKKPVERAEIRAGHGLVGDAHAGDWHRQVSLLEVREIEQALTEQIAVSAGRFAENLAVRGLPPQAYTIGTKLRVGSSVVLEISQIGKECHTRCAVYKQTGDCIMPRLGLFARVLQGGPVAVGDVVEVVP
jgi:MOSC domain-containing protein YiiM